MPSYAPYADVQVTTIVHAYGTVSSVRSRQTFTARVALRSLHERGEGNKSHLMFMRCVAMKMAFWDFSVRNLSTLSSDSSCQLDVLWHDGDPLCVDGAEIGVFEEADQVSF